MNKRLLSSSYETYEYWFSGFEQFRVSLEARLIQISLTEELLHSDY